MSIYSQSEPLCLRGMGSFHIQGRSVEVTGRQCYAKLMSEGGEPVCINPNGIYAVEQMYVQYYLPQHQNGMGPLVLWHGGGMTGAAWETTPDGREGWVNYFVRRGWDVYVCDAVERGRSGFAPYPDIWPEGPITQTVNDVFARFRIGDGADSYHIEPTLRTAYSNSRFPVEHFDTFSLQLVPRWTHTNQAVVDAFSSLLARIGRATIVCHSQSGPLAMKLASESTGLVKAVVGIEPAGIPTIAHETTYDVPTLIVLGGNMASDTRWQRLCAKILTFARQHDAVEILRLEELGIMGNSHVMMMDSNSDDIAEWINEWLCDTVACD